MPSFIDRKGNEWVVQLDAVVIQEIKDDHGINLVDLAKDPLFQLRNDPMVLVSCISVICRDQQNERNISPKDFAKLLPSPPDVMLDAVREALIGFFPSGRALHAREVLAKFDQMAEKAERLAEAKVLQLMDDPRMSKAMNQKADQVVAEAMNTLTNSLAGTVNSTASDLSTSLTD